MSIAFIWRRRFAADDELANYVILGHVMRGDRGELDESRVSDVSSRVNLPEHVDIPGGFMICGITWGRRTGVKTQHMKVVLMARSSPGLVRPKTLGHGTRTHRGLRPR